MVNVYGQTENYLLFTDDVNAVVIDKSTNMIDEVGSIALLSSLQPWGPTGHDVHSVYFELADGALADLRVHAVVASGRMYTIPKGVQAEAKKALEWHKEFGRGGTPVGMNTARILAAGGQVGLHKVKHIAKYFPRHEVDKKGKGYKPGQDGFPSNGRIAWALWGGDTAWRWARAIVEQENNKAVRADGYMLSQDGSTYEDYRMATDYDADVNAFQQAHELGDEFGPEFIARVRLDGSGIDRLYKIDLEGGVAVWDGNSWDNLGHVDSDIMTYDKSLDDPYDTVEKSHIVLDPDSALVLSAHLQQDPFKSVTVYDLDPEEASIVEAAAHEMDWTIVDSSIIAAGEAPAPAAPPAAKDGNYTPEERSQKARKQVRDKGGKFAAMGSRVVVSGNEGVSAQGHITQINPDSQSVTVKLDSGESVDVPALATQSVEDAPPIGTSIPKSVPQLDLANILGQPRTPIDRPTANIPGTLPALTSTDLQSTLYNYPAFVKTAREQEIHAQVTAEQDAYKKQREKQTGQNFTKMPKDLRQHPLFKDIFTKKPKLGLYYNPILSAAEAPAAKAPEKKTIGELAKEHTGIGEEVTPDTSDVQPIYLAIVSPDDPKAVFDLISIVPAGTQSNTPMTFKRSNATWEKDEDILSDLNSATPPPVVPLHGQALVDVMNQIDGTIAASAFSEFAQGGLDKNRGGAEKLRRYWVYGKGAAKIRWGEGGDWSRCVRHLGKYMGPRAKGYCNLRHKDALHIYPATHAKILRGGRAKHNSNDEFIMEEPLYDIFDGGDQKHKFTEVTDIDMAMELEEISSIPDENFDHEFEPDDEIIVLLRDPSTTEHDLEPIIAEGGLDRNRGNAERLRHYWVYGKGAVKIRWNTPGDWTRCYHYLMKYMGPRAKGYCSLRHKEATGFWPGSKYNVGKKNTRLASAGYADTYLLDEETVLNSIILKARANAARERVLLAGGEMNSEGSKFTIPLVIPEDTESGDGRKFEINSITMRELPLPLLWQIKTADGHDGAVVVGRIDAMERTDQGIGNAHGVFDSGAYGQEAERMVREGFMRGVSADLDQFEASEEEAPADAADDNTDHKIGGQKIIITSARVMAVTIVPKPAFEECKIYLEDTADTSQQQEEEVLQDGDYVGDVAESDAQSLVACGMVASSIPTVPPAEWFTDPKLSGPTPLTVDDDGRVFGHIAAWHVDHIGMSYGTRPPRSKSKYAYFHTGVVRAEDGKDYPVGQLTLAGGHASLEASAIDAARHYDDTGSAIADVHAGEDQFGIWVSGGLRPSASPEQIRALRASAPSGDWRPIKGGLELVAVCQVNVPGFPIARARVASGQVYALVAAGAQVLARMKADPIADLEARLARMEFSARPELAAQAEDAKARISGFVTQRNAELSARAEEVSRRFRDGVDYESFAYVSRGARKKLAEEGKALPDGSFPIRNEGDLKNAIQAYGRARPGKRASVRRHIMKRARGLEKADLIPEEWKSASAIEEDVADLRAYVASIEAQLRDSVEQSDIADDKN